MIEFYDVTPEETRSIAQAALADAFAALGAEINDELVVSDYTLQLLNAAVRVSQCEERFSREISAREGKRALVFLNVRHIVATAVWCKLNDVSHEETHPLCVGSAPLVALAQFGAVMAAGDVYRGIIESEAEDHSGPQNFGGAVRDFAESWARERERLNREAA